MVPALPKVAVALSCIVLLGRASGDRKLSEEEVLTSHKAALHASVRDFGQNEKAYLEDASMYADMGPAKAWTSESPVILRGGSEIVTLWKKIAANAGGHFKAFEESGPLKAKFLVASDDEVLVSGDFEFTNLKGRILSQTWLRVGKDSWKMKSHMFAVQDITKTLQVTANKTLKEEADIVEKSEELANGTLSADGAKKLERDIKDVSKEQRDFEDASASGRTGMYLLIGSLLFCGGAIVLVKARRNQPKYSLVTACQAPSICLADMRSFADYPALSKE